MRAPKYFPLDEQIESAPIRILRSLRFFDWIDGRDLLDACGAPECVSVERNTLTKAMSRMWQAGEIDRRRVVLGRHLGFQGVMYEFRITDKGRERIAATVDEYTRRIEGPALV